MPQPFGRRPAQPEPKPTAQSNRTIMAVSAVALAVAVIGGLAVTRLSPPPASPSSEDRQAEFSTNPVPLGLEAAQTRSAPWPELKIGQPNWVIEQHAERYTCPSDDCGAIGELYFRQQVEVHEVTNGFARISDPYDAACENGISAYVDSGPANCQMSNGIREGRLSEWIEAAALSSLQPEDPGASASPREKLVSGSDDFALYRAQFTEAAESLISRGNCTAEQIAELGGFWYAPSLKPRAAYFLWCGSNRFYLDAKTGEIWQN